MVESLVGQEYDDANWPEFPCTVTKSTDLIKNTHNFILNNKIILFKTFYICILLFILYINCMTQMSVLNWWMHSCPYSAVTMVMLNLTVAKERHSKQCAQKQWLESTECQINGKLINEVSRTARCSWFLWSTFFILLQDTKRGFFSWFSMACTSFNIMFLLI